MVDVLLARLILTTGCGVEVAGDFVGGTDVAVGVGVGFCLMVEGSVGFVVLIVKMVGIGSNVGIGSSDWQPNAETASKNAELDKATHRGIDDING